MLQALSIRDFVIVDRLRMEFASGFTVMTGETGAGKSILVDALLVVLGGRADPGVVRPGQPRAEVSAEFDVSLAPAAQAWLAANALSEPDGECILRRVVETGGRSRAFVNGQPCTAAQLRELGESLVDVHGQHEHQSLMRPAGQRALLDAFGNATPLATEVANRYREWRDAQQALEAALGDADALEAERDRLAWQVRELDELGLTAESWDTLQADHGRLAHAAQLIEGAEAGLEALAEADRSAMALVAGASQRLAQLRAHDEALAAVTDLLAGAEIQLAEAVRELRHYRQRLDLDPERLREVEAQLGAAIALARKHRVAPESLPERHRELRQRLADLGAALDPAVLEARAAETKARYGAAAGQLSAVRQAAAGTLSAAVTDAMQALAMAGGAFEVALLPLAVPAAFGAEQAEFRMAGHAGSPVAAVSKAASGGELARLSLALQTVTSALSPVPTLVFDEVDAGIGGAVAEVVGHRLRQLGTSRQVLCITHLPQVAAAGHRQWQVSKSVVDGATLSRVVLLDGAARVEEIARMLGGVRITATTRKHADEMLAAAGGHQGESG